MTQNNNKINPDAQSLQMAVSGVRVLLRKKFLIYTLDSVGIVKNGTMIYMKLQPLNLMKK